MLRWTYAAQFVLCTVVCCAFTQAAAADERYFYGTDHLGSTSVVMDETGAVVEFDRYAPYGEQTAFEVAGGTQIQSVTDFGYTGQRRDPASGLVDYGARFYDPSLGRFLTHDPAREHTNPYSYVLWNPINRKDPTGLESIPMQLGVPAGAGDDVTFQDMFDTAIAIGQAASPDGVDATVATAGLAGAPETAGASLLVAGGIYLARRAHKFNRAMRRVRRIRAIRERRLARITNPTDDFYIYTADDGTERILFRADRTLMADIGAGPGRNYTPDTLVALSEDGRAIVGEGRHRAIGAAHGKTIPEELGGVEELPGWLDFQFTRDKKGFEWADLETKDLSIDYNYPEATTMDQMRDMFFENERRHGRTVASGDFTF